MRNPAQVVENAKSESDVRASDGEDAATDVSIRHEAFEDLVAEITTQFMTGSGDLDALIEWTLSKVGDFLALDRLVYLDADVGRFVPRAQWLADEASRDLDLDVGDDLSGRFPWLTNRVLDGSPLVVNHADDLPEDAAPEKNYCELIGVQSFAFVPAISNGKVVAALGLDSYTESRAYDARILRRLQLIACIIAGAISRSDAQRQTDELRQFEQALSRISTTFVNLPPDEVDGKIEEGLRIVAEILAADHVTLSVPVDGDDLEHTHEWVADKSGEHRFKGMRLRESNPWYTSRMYQREPLIVSNLADWPTEASAERALAERMGLPSVVAVPIAIRGEPAGLLTVNSFAQRAWTKAIVYKLRLLGEVFCEAMYRRHDELELQKSYKKIEALNEKIEQENRYLRREVKLTQEHGEIIGDSVALRAALTKAEQVAATDSTVLILGETGTGKELLARWIHSASPRRDKLLVTVNCAALPSSLVEAELFGREKGAFTGALTRELGRFEIADGSTIFLDEVGELSLELQAKLLRVLQDGKFERLGSSTTRNVDVRVLAATNHDLRQAVKNNEFREDLYYRLNVFPIEMPPLRARIDDLPHLVWSFVEEFSEAMGKNIEKIPHTAMEALKAYRWPGNVRELRNIIERAMIMSRGPTLAIDLSEQNAPGSAAAAKTLDDVEREYIETIAESTGWRISGTRGAAEILGMKATTLESRMKKLGIKRPEAN